MIQNQAGAGLAPLGNFARPAPDGFSNLRVSATPNHQKNSYIFLFRVHPPWLPDYVDVTSIWHFSAAFSFERATTTAQSLFMTTGGWLNFQIPAHWNFAPPPQWWCAENFPNPKSVH